MDISQFHCRIIFPIGQKPPRPKSVDVDAMFPEIDPDHLPDLPRLSSEDESDGEKTLSAESDYVEVFSEKEDQESPKEIDWNQVGYNSVTGEIYQNQLADPFVQSLMNE